MRSLARSSPLRRLSLTLVVAGSMLGAGGLAANAVGDDAPPPPPTGDPSATAAPPAAAPDSAAGQPSPAPAPQAPSSQSGAAPVSVQVLRASASAAHSVAIVDYAYSPGAITVEAGDTVTWTNTGQDPKGHTVTGSGFDSGTLAPGTTFSHTFSGPGTFAYVCSIHPSMHGTVTVAARSSGGSGNSSPSGGGSSKGSGGSGSKGSGSSSSSTTSTPSTSGAGSESAAVSSPAAAGSSGSLPSTGSDSLGLATAGLLLIALGAAVRLLEAARSAPRRG